MTQHPMADERDLREAELEARIAQLDVGCRNCGGLPHTTDCRVRDPMALLARAQAAEAALRTIDGLLEKFEADYVVDGEGLIERARAAAALGDK